MHHKASARPKLILLLLSTALALFFILSRPAPASSSTLPPSVIINEIMYDPEGTDTGFEWIELKNVSSEPVDLKMWSIQIAGKYFIHKFYFPSYTIFPGQIILVGESDLSGLDILTTTLSLPNGGTETDGVRILNKIGNVIDTVLYDSPNINGLQDDNFSVTEDTAPDVSPGHTLARYSDVDTDNSALDFVECSTPTPGDKNTFPPFININLPESVFIYEPVTLDASASYDLDGTIENYTWSITTPAETTEALSGPSPEYIFTNIGTYSLSLTITDNDGLSTSTTTEISAIENPDDPIITPIAAVKALDLKKSVSITATITAPFGSLFEDESYAQDKTGGIRIKAPETLARLLTAGKTYTLSGKTSSTYGEPRIIIERAFPAEKTIIITPASIKIQALNEHLLGKLITTEIDIVSRRDRYLYGETLPNGITPTVYIPESIDLVFPNIKDISTVKITGIVSRYGTTPDGTPKLRIIPRSTDDISFLGSEAVLASTGIPPFHILSYGIPLIAILRSIIISDRP
jgi:hypothetical protein